MAVIKTYYRWKGNLSSCQQWLAGARENLQRNHLWQRMLKTTICTTVALIIGLVPAVIDVFGKSTYLGAMVTVFGHPGRRFGEMTEILILILLGTSAGMGWSFLGLYLSSLVMDSNPSAAYGIRAVFFTLSLILHGVLRSSTPRLFMFVFFLLLISLTVLTTTAKSVTATLASQIAYPILAAVGLVVFVNVTIFPEFSGGFLGNSTIETLCDTVRCLEDAGSWFMSDSNVTTTNTDTEKPPVASLRMKLVSLTDRKPKLRAKLASSKKAQAECNFELFYSVLPPRALKPISMGSMARLVQNTISIINACESNDSSDSSSNSSSSSSSDSSDSDSDSSLQGKPKKIRRKSKHARNLELVKPVREIESGDIKLLEHILSQVRIPAKALQDEVRKALQVITCALAYCYDVPKLPSGVLTPDGIPLEEIDIRVEAFLAALSAFDNNSAKALEQSAAMAYGDDSQADIMPRMETFLISSFLITLRQAASQISDMLKCCRVLVETRQARHERRRIYLPRISWRKWLTTGGEQDGHTLPEDARKEARAGHGLREERTRADDDDDASEERLVRQYTYEECGKSLPEKGRIPRRKGPPKSDGGTILWLRGLAADAVEFFADSDDLAFALKMTIAGFLVTWPAFVPSLNAWYGSARGSWASLQLIIVFEVSVGTSFQGFFLRAFGVITGCVWGFLAYLIGGGNRIVAVVILFLGIIPSSYVHLGTKYVKTGIISIVSMSVVALASILQPDTYPWEVFVKRLVCFLIGGTVALLVEMTLFPVRARDRLVESLASGIQQISNMEASVAVGIDSPKTFDINSYIVHTSFIHAKEKAEAALGAARTFAPFTLTEPRLKGSFKGQALIYNEIIYVLFQIIDRMDNIMHMRKTYGSSVLEELHEEVLPYRRNVAASITLTLFAVHEALTTRLPLPQFLPSSRVAQLRYIARSAPGSRAASFMSTKDLRRGSVPIQAHMLKSFTKQNLLSWNAGAAGMMEIIEYLEELVDLAKLLVGVNAFRSGMLERPKLDEYVKKIRAREQEAASTAEAEQQQGATAEKMERKGWGSMRKRRGFSLRKANSHGAAVRPRRNSFGFRTGGGDAAVDSDSDESAMLMDDLPMSLQRVRTKRMEEDFERLRRANTANVKGKAVLRNAQTWNV
ncbi:uncharacterized protein BCR38DRAFT_458185 [Pseudomassariella vexata]|uniref:ER transporter 6TM N-terminal domain-containing protein n=1 Tax=Pseudomassariella vexata TaxID=1141098 RepID=A0A1Y2DUT2_9PEZI|nr:uncharacterized protein BCR38DRAFT_458185 [Pseudomassariella vexata]ORY62904.1 hypothetical protein BCR38DRAFT_458185 [Pseudomassariella vexata]